MSLLIYSSVSELCSAPVVATTTTTTTTTTRYIEHLRLLKSWQSVRFIYHTHYYCRKTARRALLVNSGYVSRGIEIRKVSNCKSHLQGHSRAHWQWWHSIGHIRFPISVPLQLCLYLAPLTRHYHLFHKI